MVCVRVIVHLRPVVTHLRRLWCRYTRKACIDLKAPASNDLPYTKTCNMSGKSLYNPVGAFDRSVPRAVLRCILLCTVRYRYKTFHAPPALPIGGPLVDEVDAEEMQYHAPEHKVRECPVIKPRVSPYIVHHLNGSKESMGEYELRVSYLSSEVPRNSFSFSGFVCIRKLAVSTNCPTVAENPARKALKGYNRTTNVSTSTCPHFLPPSLPPSSSLPSGRWRW